MLKLTWGEAADPFKKHFVIGGAEHIMMLYFVLTHSKTNDGVQPVNIMVSNLDGIPVDMSKGWDRGHADASR